jgi:hypothetical protein
VNPRFLQIKQVNDSIYIFRQIMPSSGVTIDLWIIGHRWPDVSFVLMASFIQDYRSRTWIIIIKNEGFTRLSITQKKNSTDFGVGSRWHIMIIDRGFFGDI